MNDYAPAQYKVSPEKKHTLRDILMIFFRRRWIVAAISIPIVIFSIIGTLNTVDSFTASSQVLIEGLTVDTPSFRAQSEDHDVVMSTAGQVASSNPVAIKAAYSLMDSLEVLRAIDPRFEAVTGTEEIKGAILGGVRCSQVAESNILSINFSDENPRFALMVVAAVTRAYVEYNAESKNNEGATQYYSEQVDQLQREIDDLMGKRARVYEDGGLSSFQINNTSSIQYMRQMEYNYLNSRALRVGLEQRIESIKELIREDKYYVPPIAGNTNTVMVGSIEDFNKARLDLEKLRMSYNDSSLFVVRQQEYVEKTEVVFLRDRDMFVHNLEVELDEAVRHESSLLAAFNDYRSQIMLYPEIERQISSLDIEIGAQRKLLEALQVKRGEVRIKAESDLRVSNIIPLNVPTLVVGIGQGKKTIYLFLAAFMALILGLVGALFVDINDHKIYNRRQAEDLLEIPVLGSISDLQATARKT